MLQRGVQLSTLDASYVSSTSWYFLVMFGLKSVINLFLIDAPAQDEVRTYGMPMIEPDNWKLQTHSMMRGPCRLSSQHVGHAACS